MRVYLKDILPNGEIENTDICHFFYLVRQQNTYAEVTINKFFECIEDCLAEEGIYIKCKYERVEE